MNVELEKKLENLVRPMFKFIFLSPKYENCFNLRDFPTPETSVLTIKQDITQDVSNMIKDLKDSNPLKRTLSQRGYLNIHGGLKHIDPQFDANAHDVVVRIYFDAYAYLTATHAVVTSGVRISRGGYGEFMPKYSRSVPLSDVEFEVRLKSVFTKMQQFYGSFTTNTSNWKFLVNAFPETV